MKQWTGYQKGVNLGGWFSQCDYSEERYDTFITEKDFVVIKSWGCDHVRLPVDYNLLEDKSGAPLETGYLRLEKAIGWARKNGLNMVLDLHKTAGFSFDPNYGEGGFFENERYQERFLQLWARIAERFSKDADILAFELLNEVTEKDYLPVWTKVSHECVRRIRSFAPTIPILIGGYWHNSAAAVKDIVPPEDANIVFNFHCYEPIVFTHQGATWMPPMEPSFRIPVTACFGEMAAASGLMLNGNCSGLEAWPKETVLSPAYFTALFAEAVQAAERHGLSLYCGEYGVIDRVPPEQALVWYQAIHRAFETLGIGRAAWSYREMDFGLSDARMDGVRSRLLAVL